MSEFLEFREFLQCLDSSDAIQQLVVTIGHQRTFGDTNTRMDSIIINFANIATEKCSHISSIVAKNVTIPTAIVCVNVPNANVCNGIVCAAQIQIVCDPNGIVCAVEHVNVAIFSTNVCASVQIASVRCRNVCAYVQNVNG